jgi:hypothetical protein
MSNVYVVEYASEEWGEHPAWYDKCFNTLDEAKDFAMQKCLAGDAVRMFTREKRDEY